MGHCAPESLQIRMQTPEKLRVAELKQLLSNAGLAPMGKKAELVIMWKEFLASPANAAGAQGETVIESEPNIQTNSKTRMRSARAAAADKRAAGENAAVEHVADYEEGLDGGLVEWLELGGMEDEAHNGVVDTLTPNASAVVTPPPKGSRKRRWRA